MRALPTFTCLVCFTIFIIIGTSVTKCDEEIKIGGVSAATPVPAVVLNAARIDEGERRNDSRTDEEKRNEPRSYHYSGLPRRTGAGAAGSAGSGGGTRDSQLLVLAARRRRLLRERLAAHVATIAALAQKPNRNNTTYAQLELRDVNNTIIKRIVLGDNNSTDSTNFNGDIRIETADLKSSEVKPSNMSKIFQESKNRAGFLNNRRKAAAEVVRYASDAKKKTVQDSSSIEDLRLNNESKSISLTSVYPYIPADEKQDVVVEEAIIDPDEEFQVDESNHGAILLNYSNSENSSVEEILEPLVSGLVNVSNALNSTNAKIDDVEDTTIKDIEVEENFIKKSNTVFDNTTEITPKLKNITILSQNTNSTEARTTKNIKIEIPTNKENENNTLFLTDELYNHFRPLEAELPDEDMAPFLSFGQKLTPQTSNIDNLNTTSPNLTTAIKSEEYFAIPEKKKFTSRYSATEKYIKEDEDESNDEMDVSVIKNIIEKNKIRNTVKQTPPRNSNLVNVYRKPFISSSKLNVTTSNDTSTVVESTVAAPSNDMRTTLTESLQQNKTYINLRNTNRTSFNLRRRPVKQNNIDVLNMTSTTENTPSTSVFTAVVTSVSVTSSMKGQNKTDGNNQHIASNTFIESSNNNTAKQLLNSEQSEPDSDIIDKTLYSNKTQIQRDNIDSKPKETRPLIQRMRLRSTTEQPHVAAHSTLKPVPHMSPTITPTLEENIDTTTQVSRKVLLTTSDYIQTEDETKNAIAKPTINLRPRIGTRISLDELFHMAPNMDPDSETTVQHIFTTDAPARTVSSSIENLYVPKTASNSGFNRKTVVDRNSNFSIGSNTYNTDKVTYGSNSSPTEKITPASSDVAIQHKHVNNTSGRVPNSKNDSETETSVTNNSEVVIEVEKVYTATYILAGLGFLPLSAIVIFVLRNFFVKKTKDIDTEYEGYFQDSDIKKESPITPVARPPMPPPVKPDEKWEFPRNKLRLQTLLGQGNFGQVWKAEADDLTGHDGLTRLVAVKTIKETASQKEKQELLHEICIMQKLETHPNVVTLLACCTEQEPYLLIMEYVMCGKLLTYLRERRSRPDRFGGGSGALTSRDLTVFAYCVARGMDYLASKGIIHRDLAARNILVDHNKLCKVADFGMSRASQRQRDEVDDRDRPQRNALPVRWMAPEALLYNVYSHETDVWAYGVLLWEIVTLGSTPYAHMSGREVLHVVTEGYRLERPAHCKPQLYRAMSACWHAAPAQRPAFATLKRTLADLLDNEPAEGHYVDLESFYQDSSVYSDPSAIIQDDGGISIEYSRELKPPIKLDVPRRSFHKITNQSLRRNLSSGNYEGRNLNFAFRDDDNFTPNRGSVHVNGISSPRMGGFGIRDMGFNNRDVNFNDRKENFNERLDHFNDRKDIFNERKENMKLSGSSFHREREARENSLASRNSFNGNGFPNRLSREGRGFRELMNENGRNQRVSEFECDI